MNVHAGTTRMVGVFSDYLLGLDSLRKDLESKEDELNRLVIGYYQINGDQFNQNIANEYLRKISDSLDICNAVIANNTNRKLFIIDGEVPIASMINTLRECVANVDTDTLIVITNFWENIKYSLELFQILIDQFEKDIYSKLSLMYSGSVLSSQINSLTSENDKVMTFINDIGRYSKEIPHIVSRSRLLVRSSGTHIRPSLIGRSLLSDQLLLGVNAGQYPILKIIPDLTSKMKKVFQICSMWLNREETFVLDMNQEIRQRRLLAKEKEQRILSASEHQRDVLKIVKSYYLICQNSKQKLKELAKEIRLLEIQMKDSVTQQKQISEEKLKTKTVTEFLDISISQTRMNYGLQMKKQRLQNQIRQLENTLSDIDSQISIFKQEISVKSDQRNKTHQKLLLEEKSYSDTKEELETYSKTLFSAKTELKVLRETLLAMESLKLLKTSPEFVENIFGKDKDESPKNVHLSQSLKNSIQRKLKPAKTL